MSGGELVGGWDETVAEEILSACTTARSQMRRQQILEQLFPITALVVARASGYYTMFGYHMEPETHQPSHHYSPNNAGLPCTHRTHP